MAIIKCKMCGGDLNLVEGQSVAECEYCGSMQTVPAVDNEKKLTLFGRANRLRSSCDFDKAAGIYESIVADFPEEAESYWGLVLCKYGIEYVDDPATGKKIPTCHRSSFESVMEDSNFEQALENADAVAQRLYREEAKQIESIRKGILEVSNNEQPYDIFICYKETDYKGDRTVDSLMAQDIYDALTDKGYRVFFSRITLEDKLGQAYEPYIFSALNSARIMLAVGTCYEHYHAVWVKNEWSRYIKIVAQDKNKYLIPCYKNLDPGEDLPKEFAHLQGQDMGKVGAIQDLLRGVEKIIPREKETVKETVVIQQGFGGNAATLLRRGYMALEDGEEEQAEKFFEEVLNQDAECAEAYLGKFLAEEGAASLEKYVDSCIRDLQRAEMKQFPIATAQPNRGAEMAKKYAIPNYLKESDIKALYSTVAVPKWSSQVQGLTRKKAQLEETWNDSRSLARARQFAKGDTEKQLEAAKNRIMEAAHAAIEKARQEEEVSRKAQEQAYADRLAQCDAEAERLYRKAMEKKEADDRAVEEKRLEKYNTLCRLQEQATTPATIHSLEADFKRLGDYKDCPQRAQQCQEKYNALIAASVAEEKRRQAEADAEMERRRAIAAREAAKKKKRNTVIALIVLILLLIGAGAAYYVTQIMIPSQDYAAAEQLLAAGDYDGAISAFEKLGDFEDSVDRATEAASEKAKKYLASGDYEKAMAVFESLQDIAGVKQAQDAIQAAEDARLAAEEAVKDAIYAEAEALVQSADYVRAAETFHTLADYKDASQRAAYCEAEILLGEGSTAAAAIKFYAAGDYGDAHQRSLELWDQIADRDVIAAELLHTVGLCQDGTVLVTGGNEFNTIDSDIKDIVAVSTGKFITLGLRRDGTVAGSSYDEYRAILEQLPQVEDVVAIEAADKHIVLLRADGTTVSAGYNEYGQTEVFGWTDICDIDATLTITAGLKTDGTVVIAGKDEYGVGAAREWTGITKIALAHANIYGLKADGTVVVTTNTGDYYHWGQEEVSGWTDIVDIAAAGNHVIGLRANGTAVAIGMNKYGQCNVSGWRNIVAVFAGDDCTIGLKADGSVVAAGKADEYGELNLSGWKNIKLPQGTNQD